MTTPIPVSQDPSRDHGPAGSAARSFLSLFAAVLSVVLASLVLAPGAWAQDGSWETLSTTLTDYSNVAIQRHTDGDVYAVGLSGSDQIEVLK
jgi:hypothetical protein